MLDGLDLRLLSTRPLDLLAVRGAFRLPDGSRLPVMAHLSTVFPPSVPPPEIVTILTPPTVAFSPTYCISAFEVDYASDCVVLQLDARSSPEYRREYLKLSRRDVPELVGRLVDSGLGGPTFHKACDERAAETAKKIRAELEARNAQVVQTYEDQVKALREEITFLEVDKERLRAAVDALLPD